jgi:hypothetical protein
MTPERSAFEYLNGFQDRISLTLTNNQLREIDTWCKENIGVKYRDWFILSNSSRSGVITGGTLYIKIPKYATLFRLRWIDYMLDK